MWKAVKMPKVYDEYFCMRVTVACQSSFPSYFHNQGDIHHHTGPWLPPSPNVVAVVVLRGSPWWSWVSFRSSVAGKYPSWNSEGVSSTGLGSTWVKPMTPASSSSRVGNVGRGLSVIVVFGDRVADYGDVDRLLGRWMRCGSGARAGRGPSCLGTRGTGMQG